MQTINNDNLYLIIGNTKEELSVRIKAIQDLDLANEEKNSIILNLNKLLERNRPTTNEILIDWDPTAAERVVDLYIVKTLNILGDDTQNHRIILSITHANRFLSEPNELEVASKIIKSINDKKTYTDVFELLKSSNNTISENAVITLDNLQLENAPLRGENIKSLLSSKELSFKFSNLREEMELYAKMSNGVIILSQGVKEFINVNNYRRSDEGKFINFEKSLSDILETYISELGFDYYIEDNHIVICTYKEAANRWIHWFDETTNSQ